MKRVFFLILISLLIFTISCNKKKSQKEIDSRPYVTVEETQKREIIEKFNTSGTLIGTEEVDVYSKVSGKLIRYEISEGTWVKKDQVIAYVDRDVTGVKYKPATIKAPISGILAKNYLDKGTMIAPGQVPVSKISNMNNVKLEIELPEKYFSELKKHLKVSVTVDSYPNKSFDGYISNYSPVINQRTHTVDTEIKIANPQMVLRSGMFARIEIDFDKRNSIAIPQQAIVGDNYVYKYRDGKVYIKKVETGALYKEYIEIQGGLEVGEKIVTIGQKLLNDELEVRLR